MRHIRWVQRLSPPLLSGLLVLLWLTPTPPVRSAMQLEDRIVAVVNTDLIMLSDVKRELAPEQDRIRTQSQGDELAQRLKMAEYMALTKMIERRLQLQEAKNKGVDISDQEVKQAIQQMKQQGEKVDEADPLTARNVRDQLTLLRVVDREVRNNVMVGETEMKRYYKEHQDRFALPEEYTLSQILIQPRSADGAAEALEKARIALADLTRGEKFEDVAVRYSDGPNASRGGRLGLVRQGELMPAIERAIAPLVPGGISAIIETSEGFHLIRVDEKTPRQFRPFDEVKFEIQALVFQQKSEDVFQSWLVNLKNKAYIEIKFSPNP
ncbi:MAG: peptidyl-prolyl cis-trans isomerase [Nitrospira sp.]|nr:peptidyl-prolyl cis-trans isomerase [Nitrospira sp.]